MNNVSVTLSDEILKAGIKCLVRQIVVQLLVFGQHNWPLTTQLPLSLFQTKLLLFKINKLNKTLPCLELKPEFQ